MRLSRLLIKLLWVDGKRFLPAPGKPSICGRPPRWGALSGGTVFDFSGHSSATGRPVTTTRPHPQPHALLGRPLLAGAAGSLLSGIRPWAVPKLRWLVTGVFYRSAWRYQDRAYRRIFLDTGPLLGNIELASALADYRPHLIGSFADQAMAELMYLSGGEEGVLAVFAPGRFVSRRAKPFPLQRRFLRYGSGPISQMIEEGTKLPELFPFRPLKYRHPSTLPPGEFAPRTSPLPRSSRFPPPSSDPFEAAQVLED